MRPASAHPATTQVNDGPVMVNDNPHPHPTRRARHTLHVPTFDISGAAAPRALITWIEDRLVDLGGGFTHLSASGGWENPDGSTSRDDLLIYLVDLDDASPLALGSIAQRLPSTCIRTRST
jgi:hypothetical protein